MPKGSKKAIKRSESAGSRPYRAARQQLTPEQKQAIQEGYRLVPALCSVCQGVAMAYETPAMFRTSLLVDTDFSIYLMDEHDVIDSAGIHYGRCEGSGTQPQTTRVKGSLYSDADYANLGVETFTEAFDGDEE